MLFIIFISFPNYVDTIIMNEIIWVCSFQEKSLGITRTENIKFMHLMDINYIDITCCQTDIMQLQNQYVNFRKKLIKEIALCYFIIVV